MSTTLKVLLVLLILFLAWVAWGYFAVRNIEVPRYDVLSKQNGIEVRQYAENIVAETSVKGEYSEALDEGFLRVADYIFGNNTQDSDIAMTAPVVSEEGPADQPGEDIAMTAPVISEEQAKGSFTVAFVMPSKYSMETLPKPNNPRVTIRKVPPRKMAVLRFSGWATGSKVKRMEEELQQRLEDAGLQTKGRLELAQYNPPWTPPFMRRNEVMVELVD